MDYVQLISNVGFPIVVAGWFMLRNEKVINANTAALENLKDVIGNCPRKEK